MTTDSERDRAIRQTREFLFELLDPMQTPGVPKPIRGKARMILKHFPYETNGTMRECLNCGRVRPVSEGRRSPGEGCPSPDACTWEMTTEEAWAYWQERGY
jgi:hypothetical protein